MNEFLLTIIICICAIPVIAKIEKWLMNVDKKVLYGLLIGGFTYLFYLLFIEM